MKKALLVLVVLLVGFGGVLYFQKSQIMEVFDNTGSVEEAKDIGSVRNRKDSLSVFLPTEVDLYYEIQDFEKQIDNFNSSRFWKHAQKVFEGNVQKGGEVKKVFDVFKKFLKDDMAIAVYLNHADSSEDLNVQDKLLSFLVTVRVTAGTQFLESLVSKVGNLGQEVRLEMKTYGGVEYKIADFENQDVDFVYVRFDDVVVLSTTEEAIQSVIDVRLKRLASLLTDDLFQDSQKGQFDKNFLFLRGGKAVSSLINFLGTSLGYEDVLEVLNLDLVEKSKAYPYYAFSTTKMPKMRIKKVLAYDKNKLDKKEANLYSDCINANNDLLSFVPKDVLVYTWMGCINWMDTVEKMVGLQVDGLDDIKDYLLLLGDQMGLFVSDIEQGKNVLIPKLTIFIKLKNVEEAKKVLSLYTGSPLFNIRKVNYQSEEIYQLQTSVALGMQLGYAFIEDYIFITTHIETLKESIDISDEKGNSFASNLTFRKVSNEDVHKGHFALYLDVKKVVAKVKPYMNLIQDFALQQFDKEGAFTEGIEQRVKDIERSVERKKYELIKIQEERILLEANTETEGFQERLVSLEEKIKEINQDIQIGYEKIQESREVLLGFKDNQSDKDDVKENFEKKIKPLFDAFENVGVVSIRSIVRESSVEMNGILNLQ